MLKYRDAKLIRSGFIGVVLIVLVIAVGLAPERLMSLATTIRYQALFSEAGGIAAGNNVLVSGVKVGTVSDVVAATTATRWSPSSSTARSGSARKPPHTSVPDHCWAHGC